MHFRALGMREGWNCLCVMCVVLPTLLWLMECLTLTAQMDQEMIDEHTLVLCRVCLCSPLNLTSLGALPFSPKNSPCCTEVVLLLLSLKIC